MLVDSGGAELVSSALVRQKARERTRRPSHRLVVGVFGLAACYPLLLGRLTSKLADVLVVGVAGFEPTTSSSRTKRATKLRHTPCAAGDSIASTHRGEEIGAIESSVT